MQGARSFSKSSRDDVPRWFRVVVGGARRRGCVPGVGLSEKDTLVDDAVQFDADDEGIVTVFAITPIADLDVRARRNGIVFLRWAVVLAEEPLRCRGSWCSG